MVKKSSGFTREKNIKVEDNQNTSMEGQNIEDTQVKEVKEEVKEDTISSIERLACKAESLLLNKPIRLRKMSEFEVENLLRSYSLVKLKGVYPTEVVLDHLK